jgi:hypothetical protein
MGLPYRPVEGVSVVTDNRTCSMAIDAYNALYQRDTASFVSRALVILVASNRYIVWGVRPRLNNGGGQLFFLFDGAFHFVKLLS